MTMILRYIYDETIDYNFITQEKNKKNVLEHINLNKMLFFPQNNILFAIYFEKYSTSIFAFYYVKNVIFK